MVNLENENIYGHTKRLKWIISQLNKENVIIELGCGTGYMISRPLAKMGYKVIGIDLDKESIAYGQKIFQGEGLDPNCLKAINISELDIRPDVIIASEVLEHINDEDIGSTLTIIHNKLNPGGRLLVTVPNGYGWFELESFLWFKIGLGHLLEWLQIENIIHWIKKITISGDIVYSHPSTLTNSPHVQRFTYNTIQKLLKNHGYDVSSIRGSVLFCGPFSNLMFTGVKSVMRFNSLLGIWFPKIASGFYVTCKISHESAEETTL